MRAFHTKNQFDLELKGYTSSIGRVSSHPLLQVGKFVNSDSSSVHGGNHRPLSSQSKWSVMLKNLNQGLEFMQRQNSNLNEMEKSLSHWRNSLANNKTGVSFSFAPETYLYLQAILRFSEEKLFDHPLFGSGFEPPIRIHLNLKGKRFVQEVPVVPLLNQPGFCALVHSGRGTMRPSDTLFDSCEMEFVNALLMVDRNIEGLRRQLRIIEEKNPRSAFVQPPPNRHERESLSPVSSGLSRFMDWMRRSIKLWRGAQAYRT
jgi:hypothetical protein